MIGPTGDEMPEMDADETAHDLGMAVSELVYTFAPRGMALGHADDMTRSICRQILTGIVVNIHDESEN